MLFSYTPGTLGSKPSPDSYDFLPGRVPKPITGVLLGSEREVDRAFARRVFNTHAVYKPTGSNYLYSGMMLNTGYRSVMNAGDVFGRDNMSCGGVNQVNNVRGSVAGNLGGGISNNGCGTTRTAANPAGGSTRLEFTVSASDPATNPIWSGNNRYVVDGSDYTRYRRARTANRLYNDASFGGDIYSASQTAVPV